MLRYIQDVYKYILDLRVIKILSNTKVINYSSKAIILKIVITGNVFKKIIITIIVTHKRSYVTNSVYFIHL